MWNLFIVLGTRSRLSQGTMAFFLHAFLPHPSTLKLPSFFAFQCIFFFFFLKGPRWSFKRTCPRFGLPATSAPFIFTPACPAEVGRAGQRNTGQPGRRTPSVKTRQRCLCNSVCSPSTLAIGTVRVKAMRSGSPHRRA